jgi:hypothetical protein
MDWVKERAAQLKERESRSQKEREWTLHREAVLPSKAQELFERLKHSLGRCVTSFNDEFPGDPDRHFQFDGGQSLQAIIRRVVLPEVRVTVNLNLTQRSIDYERCVIRTAESEPLVKEGSFTFYLADTDDLYLLDAKGSRVSCDDAARIILGPVL